MPTAPSEILDGTPPSDVGAERMLLGSLLIDPGILPAAAGLVRVADFYTAANGKVFAAMLALCEEDGGVDVELLCRRLKADGELEGDGWALYLAETAQASPVAQNAIYYARIVARKAKYRAVIAAGLDLLRRGYAAKDEPRELLDQAEARLAGVETDEYEGAPVKASEAASVAMCRIYQVERSGQTTGLMTGLETFDLKFGGLFPGELCVLAARTSVGKTSLACQVADHNARKARGVYLVSLEMSAAELATRMLCATADVDSRLVRRAELQTEGVNRLAAASQFWSEFPLWIHDRPGITVPEISRWSRRFSKEGLALVVVDYLQLITPLDRRVARHEQLGQMTASLKSLARELDVPVLCLAQLSRAADQDEKSEPRLSHFRESGSIEQDSDMALMLWRNPKDQTEDGSEVVRLVVKKNRNGPTGFVYLCWHPERTRFDCGE